MDLSGFFSSVPGMYLTQSVSHSLIAALIVDAALRAWDIGDPVIRQRFRLIVMLIGLFSFPCYQLIAPHRNSLSFRLDALFDSGRWMHLDLWAGVSGWMLFVVLLTFTAVVFFAQELIPITRHTLASRNVHHDGERAAEDSRVVRALDAIPLRGKRPDVFLIDDEEYLLFSSTGSRAAIFISSAFVAALSDEELRAALAHEAGHIERSRRPLLVAVFLLRVLLFFSPVALMEFRRIVQEEEKICDDIAVRLTGNARVLAGVLRKFYSPAADLPVHAAGDAPGLRDRIEEYSHTVLVESRVSRLEGHEERRSTGLWFVLVMTVMVVVAVTYNIV
jgi:Zn-dependent protease with chaperone function